MFYVGHVGKSILYETLFHCDILSKHHHVVGVHRDLLRISKTEPPFITDLFEYEISVTFLILSRKFFYLYGFNLISVENTKIVKNLENKLQVTKEKATYQYCKIIQGPYKLEIFIKSIK
jgi:hypothetical protein